MLDRYLVKEEIDFSYVRYTIGVLERVLEKSPIVYRCDRDFRFGFNVTERDKDSILSCIKSYISDRIYSVKENKYILLINPMEDRIRFQELIQRAFNKVQLNNYVGFDAMGGFIPQYNFFFRQGENGQEIWEKLKTIGVSSRSCSATATLDIQIFSYKKFINAILPYELLLYQKVAFTMGVHKRLGEKSSVKNFMEDKIFDPKILTYIFNFDAVYDSNPMNLSAGALRIAKIDKVLEPESKQGPEVKDSKIVEVNEEQYNGFFEKLKKRVLELESLAKDLKGDAEFYFRLIVEELYFHHPDSTIKQCIAAVNSRLGNDARRGYKKFSPLLQTIVDDTLDFISEEAEKSFKEAIDIAANQDLKLAIGALRDHLEINGGCVQVAAATKKYVNNIMKNCRPSHREKDFEKFSKEFRSEIQRATKGNFISIALVGAIILAAAAFLLTLVPAVACLVAHSYATTGVGALIGCGAGLYVAKKKAVEKLVSDEISLTVINSGRRIRGIYADAS